MTMDNIRFAKKRSKNRSEVDLCELKNIHDPLEYPVVENVGLGERFASTLKKNLDVIHQVEPSSGVTETCGSVMQRAFNIANFMRSKDVQINDVILIGSRSHSNQTVALLAALFAGVIATPIDSELSLEEGQFLINSLKPRMAFCDPRCLKVIEKSCKEQKIKCHLVDFSRDIHVFTKLPTSVTNFEVVKIAQPKKTCCFIIPTQGTTADKKLVRVSHYAILSQLGYVTKLLLMDVKTIMSFFPLSYYMQIILVCYCFDQPITKILAGNFHERTICKLIHDFAIDSIILTPYYCCKLYSNPAVHDYDIACLRSIFLGGAPLGNSLVTDLLRAFMKVKLFVWYAITEVGLVSGMQIEDVNEVLHNVVNCGTLYPQARARVVDINTRLPVSPGIIGEICVQSSCMMIGYQNNQRVAMEHGFFKTGDIGFYDAMGYIYVRGRIEEMIRAGDQMFCAIEIEDIILKNPQVQDVVVFGKGMNEIIACVVKTQDSTDLTPEKLMKYVADRTPEGRRPTQITFFHSLPKTPIGKVKRDSLEDTIFKIDISRSSSINSM